MTDRAVSSKKDRRHRRDPAIDVLLEDLGEFLRECRIIIVDVIQKKTTVYNFDTIDVDGKPEVQFKRSEILVADVVPFEPDRRLRGLSDWADIPARSKGFPQAALASTERRVLQVIRGDAQE